MEENKAKKQIYDILKIKEFLESQDKGTDSISFSEIAEKTGIDAGTVEKYLEVIGAEESRGGPYYAECPKCGILTGGPEPDAEKLMGKVIACENCGFVFRAEDGDIWVGISEYNEED